MTVTLTGWIRAKTTKQTFRAIERWSKLKSVIIRPLRGGKKRKNSGALCKWQKNMERWINGEWESVWQEACELEERRTASQRKRPRKMQSSKPEEELMRRWNRVKKLVNDGELSKAAREIDGAGVAEPSSKVVADLRRKYPKRRQ